MTMIVIQSGSFISGIKQEFHLCDIDDKFTLRIHNRRHAAFESPAFFESS